MCEIFLDKYIKPYVWQGSLTCNGGWGPKNEVIDISEQLLNSGLMIKVDPVCDLLVTELEKPLNLPQLEIAAKMNPKLSGERYDISFPGEHGSVLPAYIDGINALKIETAQIILDAYNEEFELIPNLYRLIVTIKKGKTEYRLYKGNWVPSYELSLPVSGWIN